MRTKSRSRSLDSVVAALFSRVRFLRSATLSGIARVVSGHNAAIFGRAAEAVKHLVGRVGDADDRFPTVVFAAEIGGHHADHVRALAREDDARIVSHALELAGLIGDAKILRQFPRNITLLVNAEKIEKLLGELLVQNFSAV